MIATEEASQIEGQTKGDHMFKRFKKEHKDKEEHDCEYLEAYFPASGGDLLGPGAALVSLRSINQATELRMSNEYFDGITNCIVLFNEESLQCGDTSPTVSNIS
ncbi:hypothetical protein QQP08_014995 [Theobroma cacao]|nr:hypothetical protein QQP08_014995 [Theobroma cacao]